MLDRKAFEKKVEDYQSAFIDSQTSDIEGILDAHEHLLTRELETLRLVNERGNYVGAASYTLDRIANLSAAIFAFRSILMERDVRLAS